MEEIFTKLQAPKEKNKRLPFNFARAMLAVIIIIAFVGLFIYLPDDELVNGLNCTLD